MKMQPPPTKETFVYEALREQILSGQLKPGTPLIQSEIANQLSVSAIPVREAIQRLYADGLVENKPHRSATVTRLSRKDLEEFLYIRLGLEVVATRLAVPHIGSYEITELRSMNEKMREALETNKLFLYGKYNKEFHLRIYASSPYQRLYQMIFDLWANTDRHRARSIFVLVPGLAEKSYQDHEELINLIERGDAEGASALTDVHKRNSIKLFLNKLEEDKEIALPT